MIFPEQLKEILPYCRDPEGWAFDISEVVPYYGIDCNLRLAAFLAQVGHESMHLNRTEENLNYSASALRRVFGKYFPDDRIAARYARQPVWIASRVYAGRMGNGSENSQEGWKFRGRGLIQVTGKNNYTRCSEFLFDDHRLLDDPDILLEPEYALRSACWYWTATNLNRYADDVKRVTRLVNGGYHGLKDRQQIFDRAMRVLS